MILRLADGTRRQKRQSDSSNTNSRTVAGTDSRYESAGLGLSMANEIGELVRAGMPPLEAIINSDCTGSLTGVEDFAIVVLNGGSEITGVGTDKNTTSILDARVQNATGCSKASLSGMYSITLAGFGTPPPHLSPGTLSVPVALGGLATLNGNAKQ